MAAAALQLVTGEEWLSAEIGGTVQSLDDWLPSDRHPKETALNLWTLNKPADALRAQMARRRLGVAETARAIGVSRQQLHLIRRGARFTAAQAVRLEQIFDVPASQWMALQVDHDIAKARMRLAGA